MHGLGVMCRCTEARVLQRCLTTPSSQLRNCASACVLLLVFLSARQPTFQVATSSTSECTAAVNGPGAGGTPGYRTWPVLPTASCDVGMPCEYGRGAKCCGGSSTGLWKRTTAPRLTLAVGLPVSMTATAVRGVVSARIG